MEGSLRAILAAFAANVGIAIAKFVGFLFTGSSSLLAETLHSVADTTDQGLLLLGRRRARHRETHEHPFGFGNERYFWAFVVSILIFALGSMFAIYEGVTSLRSPDPVRHPLWAIGILLVALALDSLSLRTAVAQTDRRDDESWRAYVRRTKRPEIAVILLEDSAAVTGVLIALLGVGLTLVTGDGRYDAIGSIGIGLLLGGVATLLAREMKSLLIGEAASTEVRAAIRQTAVAHPRLRRLVYLRTLHLGPGDILVEMKVELDPDLDFRDVAVAIDEIEQQLRSQIDEVRLISIEPEIPQRGEDPDRPDWLTDMEPT